MPQHMLRALELAERGRGAVEPNPLVGCVIVQHDQVVGEGWHERYGGPHAEINALAVAGSRARGAALYVTLEPCCHVGKTPACTQAIIAAGIGRVVAAMRDPFPAVAGQGFAQVSAAGIELEIGVMEEEARRLNAPYLKLLTTGRPWIIAKWAMSLDGKIATRTGDSRWISGEDSRAVVHELRGRVDAVMIGRTTAETDDPLLTARPPGVRTATRIVVDSRGSLASDRQLVRTAREAPVLVAVSESADAADCGRLRAAGCEVFACCGETHAQRLEALLAELGRRRMTNILVEGGGKLLGSLFDAGHIDEVHVFIAPKLIGGHEAPGPLASQGHDLLAKAKQLSDLSVQQVGGDIYVRGGTETRKVL